MPDQKISQLTAIVTVDNSTDVLPIVDISANTTKKVTPTQLKTSLSLDNVDNTSDANKPVSIAQQDALNAKVSSNAAITAGTAPKITFDAKGLVTSGDSLDETDLPTGINANKIGTGVVSTTEFEYLNGVTSAIQTQLNAKQATLVSGTNIKTINSTSLLGSGDITIAANPSGVAGAIQFSNGSAFASDASNLFWDDTNNRLGVGTNAPTYPLEVVGQNAILINSNLFGSYQAFKNSGGGTHSIGFYGNAFVTLIGGTATTFFSGDGTNTFGNGLASLVARVGIKGSGSTSATTSLLVQNSTGDTALQIKDNREFSTSGGDVSLRDGALFIGSNFLTTYGQSIGFFGAPVSSAIVEMQSTTRGFLPPRMTTTQKNAIATPAAGLVVYDTTTNKLCCYNGSTWNDLF